MQVHVNRVTYFVFSLNRNIGTVNTSITPKIVNQTGSFNRLVMTVSTKNVSLDAVVEIASPLIASSTDLIQLNDASVHPYSGSVLSFYGKSNKTFYQAYVSTAGMISVLSPIPAGSYMLSGSWISK